MIDEIKVVLTLILCEITKTEMARTLFLEMLASSLPIMDLQHFTTRCILSVWMLIPWLYLLFFPAAPQTYPELFKGRIHGKDGSQGK